MVHHRLGQLLKWAPFLPELPEHRRLGYRPPRDLDDVVVVSGGEPVYAPGPMGWMQRKMNEAQKQAMERSGVGAGRRPTAPDGSAEVIEAEVVTSRHGEWRRGQARNRGKGKNRKAGADKQRRDRERRLAATMANGSGSAVPSGAVIVQRKARPSGDSGSGHGKAR